MEYGCAIGLVGANILEVAEEPGRTSFGESLVDGSFVEGKVFEGGLVINWAGIHGFCEFHDGITEIFVASEDGRFDRGGAAVFWEEGRVEVENAFRFEKFEEVSFNHDAERGENAEGVGVFAFQAGGFSEVFAGAGVENDVDFWLVVFVLACGFVYVLTEEDGFGKVGEGAVAEEDDFQAWSVGLRGLSASFGISHRGKGPCW